MSGENFNLNDDQNILTIRSPQANLGGPYKVVYKSLEERWAIVLIEWDGLPRLGIRWFWGNAGSPLSTGYPVWMVVPPTLSNGILSTLPLDHLFRREIDNFLFGEISGDYFL